MKRRIFKLPVDGGMMGVYVWPDSEVLDDTHLAVQLPVKGKWLNIHVDESRDGNPGIECFSGEVGERKSRAAEISLKLDEGSLVFGDPSYILDGDDRQRAIDLVNSDGFGKIDLVSDSGERTDVFVCMTLWGDGVYELIAELEGGKLVECAMDFDDEEDDEEDDD